MEQHVNTKKIFKTVIYYLVQNLSYIFSCIGVGIVLFFICLSN